MNTHAQVALEQGSEESWRDARPSASPERLSWAERLGATVPLISAPAFFGPPVIFILGPWLLLVLLLIGPAALLITFVLVAAVAVGLLVALGAVIASPYLLVRHVRARHQIARGEGSVKPSLRPRPIHLTTR
jgi:hypothetical protein